MISHNTTPNDHYEEGREEREREREIIRYHPTNSYKHAETIQRIGGVGVSVRSLALLS